MGAMYFLQFIVNFPCYSMGISFFCQFSMLSNCYFAFFFHFLLIFHVIQWKMCIFLWFVNFPCYSMGSLQVVIFPCYSMGSLHFIIFPCYSMEIWELRRFRGGRTDGRKEIHPCVLQDIGPLGPLPKKELRQAEIGIWKENPQGNPIEFQWA